MLPIWEGTTNILSLDLLRVHNKSHGCAFKSLFTDISERISHAHPQLSQSCDRIQTAVNKITNVMTRMDNSAMEHAARELSMSLSQIYIGMNIYNLIDGKIMNFDQP